MLYSFCSLKELKTNTIISYTDINFSRKLFNKLFKEEKYISVAVDKNGKNIGRKDLQIIWKI